MLPDAGWLLRPCTEFHVAVHVLHGGRAAVLDAGGPVHRYRANPPGRSRYFIGLPSGIAPRMEIGVNPSIGNGELLARRNHDLGERVIELGERVFARKVVLIAKGGC
jgi:hypothetical protein